MDANNPKPIPRTIVTKLKMSQGKSRPGLLFFEAAIRSGMVTAIMTTKPIIPPVRQYVISAVLFDRIGEYQCQ